MNKNNDNEITKTSTTKVEILNNQEKKRILESIDNLKRDILLTGRKIQESANEELTKLFAKIGKTISENQKYGSYFINTLSKSIKRDFGNVKGFSSRNLARMRKFYECYKDLSNLPTALAKLPWTFNCLLIDKIGEIAVRIWYAEKCKENSWSYKELEEQIETDLFSRQADNRMKLSNLPETLPMDNAEIILSEFKDPYIFKIMSLDSEKKEIEIEDLLVNDIAHAIMEFGKGFSFVGNQVRINIENKDYYVDLLFYHVVKKCYVVVELKNTDFQPKYVGQLQFYVKAVEESFKGNEDNQTIGLLLCKSKDRYSVSLSLQASKTPLVVSTFELKQYLPNDDELNYFLKKSKITKKLH